jgi:hypothetical protein
MREHVDHSGRSQLEPVLMTQHVEIARKGPGMAGHVNHAPRRKRSQRRQHFECTGSRGIKQH